MNLATSAHSILVLESLRKTQLSQTLNEITQYSYREETEYNQLHYWALTPHGQQVFLWFPRRATSLCALFFCNKGRTLPPHSQQRTRYNRVGSGHRCHMMHMLKQNKGVHEHQTGSDIPTQGSTCNAGDIGLICWSRRSQEKGMTIHSSILPWRIPWTEEPGGLHNSWGCKESDKTEHLYSILILF